MKKQLRKITWEDAHMEQDWQELKDSIPYLLNLSKVCETVGWVIGEDDDHIAVAQTISEDEMTCGRIVIPTRSILYFEELKSSPAPSTAQLHSQYQHSGSDPLRPVPCS